MESPGPVLTGLSARTHFALLLFPFLATAAAALCGGVGLSGSAAQAQTAPAPWQRTEAREACNSFNVLRNPYFGETHSHTGLLL